MCTLSFLAGTDGFSLAMNRDEQRTRPLALPPTLHQCGQLSAWYPSEPGGGTWIGINSRGLALALLNSYGHPQRPGCVSRGHLIPRLLRLPDLSVVDQDLTASDLDRINPFRLLAWDPMVRQAREFSWNGQNLFRAGFAWQTAHWFSSAFDEPGVITARTAAAAEAVKATDVGTLGWARRLHASHAPERGPYSICMHRPDAKTVSYTEITWHGGHVQIDYLGNSPCHAPGE